MSSLMTWKDKIVAEMKRHGETGADVVAHTLTDEQLATRYTKDISQFTVWTKNRIYLSQWCGGVEILKSVNRNPDHDMTARTDGFKEVDEVVLERLKRLHLVVEAAIRLVKGGEKIRMSPAHVLLLGDFAVADNRLYDPTGI